MFAMYVGIPGIMRNGNWAYVRWFRLCVASSVTQVERDGGAWENGRNGRLVIGGWFSLSNFNEG